MVVGSYWFHSTQQRLLKCRKDKSTFFTIETQTKEWSTADVQNNHVSQQLQAIVTLYSSSKWSQLSSGWVETQIEKVKYK